jgi:hypothetical protein
VGRRGNVQYQNPWAAKTTRRGDPVAAEFGPLHAGGNSPGGPIAWRPLPTAGPEPLQKGVYGDSLLNEFPAKYDQPQLHQGVEGLTSNWWTPTVSPLYTFQQTQRPANVAGGQRFAGKPGGPLGPISSRALAARVAAAQVRQSGLQATDWAQSMTGG